MLDLSPTRPAAAPPFDATRLDELLHEAGLDALVVTSAHNVRWLLGAELPPAHEQTLRVGLSRGLPAVVYRRGAPEQTLVVGAEDEARGARETTIRWSDEPRHVSTSAACTGDLLVRWCTARLPRSACVGVELSHLPTDAYAPLAQRRIALCDASEPLEQLRAVKRPDQLDAMRHGAGALLDALGATFAAARTGDGEDALLARLHAEQAGRGLVAHRALAATGARRRIAAGDVVSIDAVASHHGWIATVARTAVAGAPTARQRELLAQVEHVRQRTRAHARPGTRGGDLYAAGRAAIADCEDRARLSLAVDGIGLLAREAPRLTPAGSPPGPAPHAHMALETGMVLSIAVRLVDPVAGLVRVTDTVVVAGEPEPVTGTAPGWSRIAG